MNTFVLVLVAPILLGILELTILQFVGLPTIVLNIVDYIHYQKGQKWVLPAYFSLAFLVEGINLILIQDALLPIGWASLLMGFVILLVEWDNKKTLSIG
jgi:hypothetical protein